MSEASNEWKSDSLHWRGSVLTGKYGHWCPDWDYLPIDETCPEWPCACAEDMKKELDLSPSPEQKGFEQ